MPRKRKNMVGAYSYYGRSWFPWVLIIMGIYFLARDLGWIRANVSFWPVILIVVGIAFLLCNQRRID